MENGEKNCTINKQDHPSAPQPCSRPLRPICFNAKRIAESYVFYALAINKKTRKFYDPFHFFALRYEKRYEWAAYNVQTYSYNYLLHIVFVCEYGSLFHVLSGIWYYSPHMWCIKQRIQALMLSAQYSCQGGSVVYIYLNRLLK